MEHRPPPRDHGFLDVDGTRRGTVHRQGHRREPIASFHCVRQAQHAGEHGWHPEAGRALEALYQYQRLLRLEAPHHDQLAARCQHGTRVPEGRAVIQGRRGEEDGIARACLHQRGQPGIRTVVRAGHRRALDALGLARGAGRIQQHLPASGVGQLTVVKPRGCLVPVQVPGHLPRAGNAAYSGIEQAGQARHCRRLVGRDGEHACTTVRHDIGELLRRRPCRDRREVDADALRGKTDRQERWIVLQAEDQRVSRPKALAHQQARTAIGPPGQFAIRQ